MTDFFGLISKILCDPEKNEDHDSVCQIQALESMDDKQQGVCACETLTQS